MTKNIAIVHFNTPELTEATILSVRKHGGEKYKVFILDNSDKRPFTKKIKGVKVFDNTKGHIIDFDAELAKYPEKDPKYGCAAGCWYGSDKHMMSVQKLWELVPDGFVLLDSDVLLKQNIDWMFMEDQCAVGYVSHRSYGGHARYAPMLLWINVPMCVAGGARFFDPDRAWALHQGHDPRNFWDVGAAFVDDISRLKPQCHGKAITRTQFFDHIEHYGSGSWKNNDEKQQRAWLNIHRKLWYDTDQIALMAIGRHENQYAPEWVEHHLGLGFDKIFIFDDNREGEERLEDVLGKYVKKGKVVIEKVSGANPMLPTFRNCYNKHKDEFAWIMDMDFDEFLVLPNGENIHTFMKRFPDADCVKINWMTFGDNGLITNDGRPVQERFTEPLRGEDGRTESWGENIHVKSLVRGGKMGLAYYDSHCPHNAGRYVCANGDPSEQSPFNRQVDHSVAYIKHYTTKTLEEWMTNKVQRGQCDSDANRIGLQQNAIPLFFSRNERTPEKDAWLDNYMWENSPNKDVKIFVCAHSDFAPVVSNRVYETIDSRTNGDFYAQSEKSKKRVPGPFYSELLHMYRVSQRKDLPKYIGFVQYRKYFSFMDAVPDIPSIIERRGMITPAPVDIVLPMREQWKTWGNVEDLDITTQIINEKYPELAKTWNSNLQKKTMHPGSLHVMKVEDWKEMVSVAWDVANEYLKRIGGNIDKRIEENPAKYHIGNHPLTDQPNERRVGGNICERIVSAWADWKYQNAAQFPMVIVSEKIAPNFKK